MTHASTSAVRLCRGPGLHRLPGRRQVWVDDAGAPVQDAAELARLRALSVPPGWTDVWASNDPVARIQATGVDARGRTQYRYSARATENAARAKFHDLLGFAGALPQLRARVGRDITSASSDDECRQVLRVAATAVRLLDRGLFRVGNGRYARDNETYGLTTLTREQVAVDGTAVVFTFVGKEHRPWRVEIEDAAVTEVVRELLEQRPAPDGRVFAARTARALHPISSTVVNAYIHGVVAEHATAKTFRTWGGTAAVMAMLGGATAHDAPQSRRPDLGAIDVAAHLLGNTRAVARRSYVHPAAFHAGTSGEVRAAVDVASARVATRDVRALLHVDDVVRTMTRQLADRAAPSTNLS
ncbi:DNA topoisomerase IB [Promicromonospora sp. NPDC050262]|uniref:DNA topoisomerase IB n=1 Tax=Promicromonospora sp. NPDC050262 TaxID=3155036 RepID=UPI00340F05F4